MQKRIYTLRIIHLRCPQNSPLFYPIYSNFGLAPLPSIVELNPHANSLFIPSFVINMIKEGDKLQNGCDVLIVVTKYNKFWGHTTTVGLLFSCYMCVNSFLFLHYTYLFLLYDIVLLCISLETPVFWVSSFIVFAQQSIIGCLQ